MIVSQQEWQIGLTSWIIQDGNYDDFETGQITEFALEFYSPVYRSAKNLSRSCKALGAAKYSITGEVVFLAAGVWVLDFGICAFQESKPPEGVGLGDFVIADVYLGIDPFFYFEYLYALPGIPALIYSWSIQAIKRESAPLIETRNASGQKILTRDETKLGYESIRKTDAWHDDCGSAEYVLDCSLLSAPPKHAISGLKK